ncbi:unnamed protein product, partial [Prorocentrum cordatum]
ATPVGTGSGQAMRERQAGREGSGSAGTDAATRGSEEESPAASWLNRPQEKAELPTTDQRAEDHDATLASASASPQQPDAPGLPDGPPVEAPSSPEHLYGNGNVEGIDWDDDANKKSETDDSPPSSPDTEQQDGFAHQADDADSPAHTYPTAAQGLNPQPGPHLRGRQIEGHRATHGGATKTPVVRNEPGT